MVNFNGTIVSNLSENLEENRAFLYGDAIFETVKVLDRKILFLEDHYFRLMSGMRILRMDIPMDFTMEYFESQILSIADAVSCANSARVRLTVFRNSGGFYLPSTNNVSFVVKASPQENTIYKINKTPYEVDLFKDFMVTSQLLSTLKTTNRLVNITGNIFANENGFDNCLLLNDAKNVIEGLQENIFMLTGSILITPPISEGCQNGIMRKQILSIATKFEGIQVIEQPISPFELQKADELFLTNVVKGIQPITKYRKKEYTTEFSERLLKALNAQIRLFN